MIDVTCKQCQQLFQIESGSLMAECPHCGVPMLLSETETLPSSIIADAKENKRDSQSEDLLTNNDETSPEALSAIPEEKTSPSIKETSLETIENEFSPDEAAKQFVPKTDSPQKKGVSGRLFFLLFSYASLVTIAFAYYFWMTSNFNPHVLENLPDVEPQKNKNGSIQSLLIPENAEMPRGHTLNLGESRRFGDVVVTPLRVTRGSIKFVSYDKSLSQRNLKPSSKDLLKLWLKFENVSKNITVQPLGRKLTFKRGMDSNGSKLRANHFVCQLNDKMQGENIFLLYDLAVDDVWDLKDQNIDRELKPGESLETYLPSDEESIGKLTGELIWRVHFRKGHHAQSLRGVTTLFEVQFSDKDITQENSDL